MHWYLQVLKKYADFNGRARRKEYWYFYLINLVISFVLGFSASLFRAANPESIFGIFLGGLTLIYSLGIFIPSLAVGVRRLHDTNRSGVWLLIGFVPFVGAIILIYFFVLDSQPGENQYGPNPKENQTADVGNLDL